MLNQAHTWAEPDLFLMADEQIIEKGEKAVRRICPIESIPVVFRSPGVTAIGGGAPAAGERQGSVP
jgi:hypothetical protein